MAERLTADERAAVSWLERMQEGGYHVSHCRTLAALVARLTAPTPAPAPAGDLGVFLAGVEGRLGAVTPDRWEARESIANQPGEHPAYIVRMSQDDSATSEGHNWANVWGAGSLANAALIANAPADLRRLLDELYTTLAIMADREEDFAARVKAGWVAGVVAWLRERAAAERAGWDIGAASLLSAADALDARREAPPTPVGRMREECGRYRAALEKVAADGSSHGGTWARNVARTALGEDAT